MCNLCFTISQWIACRGESRNPFASKIKHFLIKKTGKSLAENTVNNLHTELYLRFLNLVVQIYQTSKKIEHQNKLTAHWLIFSQITSLINIFERFVSHFIFKHPVKWNSNTEINRFSKNTSYLAKIRTLNGILQRVMLKLMM